MNRSTSHEDLPFKEGKHLLWKRRFKEIIRGVKVSFPLVVSFIPFAMTLGAQSAVHGMTLPQVAFMCGFNFAGGSEFVAVGLWKSYPPLLLIAFMTLLVNSRHLLMGVVMIPYFRRLSWPKTLLALFLMCDESWALSLRDTYQRAGKGYRYAFSFPFYMGLALSMYLSWVILAVYGAIFGPMLGNLTQYGFDMAISAIFLVLLKGMWKGWYKSIPWVVSLIVACFLHLLVPGAWYMIIGAMVGLITAYFLPLSSPSR